MTSPGLEVGGTATPLVPATARRSGRRRRPTGAAPPLPRTIGVTGKAWLGALAVLLAWVAACMVWPGVRHATDRIDAALLRPIAELRQPWLTDVADRIDRVGSGWTPSLVALVTMVLLTVFRRWRHLFTFLGCVAVLQLVGSGIYDAFTRPRPFDVTQVGRWAGWSMPSAPVGVLALILVSVAYALVVAGPPRTRAKLVAGVLVVVYAGARLVLGVDHPLDVVVAGVLGVALPVNAFRLFTPNDVFPVVYRRGKTAHLDVGGARGEAIRRAVLEQLGLTVIEIRPVGLAGSGGSTPLRLTVQGDPDTHLFAKLYAMNHVRADRWYKLGRTILYGRLEDEAPFQSVRRLVEYEDYALRLLADIGIPTATPYGIVEITPEREYLLVTEFFDGAVEIGEAEVDDGVIDEGLALVRELWDAGLAHRDIKPANLMVRDGHVLLIDVFFVQVRPSPWRQAVDLANMMLVLAVRTDAPRVYERALRYFTPDEIAEAFAAARGVASPTQLRTLLKRDGRDLVAQFRALGPPRRPISLQRWSVRRVAIALGLVVGAGLVVTNVSALVRPVHDIPVSGTPECGTGDLMVLMAQAVPAATALPCITSIPVGWELGGVHIRQGQASFWLDSHVAGPHAVEAALLPSERCDVAGATPVPSDEVGMQRYERPEQLRPRLRTTRTYLFAGGCATFRYDFADAADPSLVFAADQALAFTSRALVVREVARQPGLALCGAGARCSPAA